MAKFIGLGFIALGFIVVAPMNIGVGMIVALIGLMMTWSAERTPTKTPERANPQTEYRVPCPYCAEMIRPAAIVCRFCGAELTEE